MSGPVLPCGCPVADNLFDTVDGGTRLIVLPGTSTTPPAVWCIDHYWVRTTDSVIAELTEVKR
jgi:hypothetical protein